MLVQHPGNRRKSLHLLRAFSSWRRQRQQKKKEANDEDNIPRWVVSRQFFFPPISLPSAPMAWIWRYFVCWSSLRYLAWGRGKSFRDKSCTSFLLPFFSWVFANEVRKGRKKNLEPIRTSSRWETILQQAEDGNGKGSNWELACNPGGVTCSPAVPASLLEVSPRSDSLWEKNHFLRITCQ